MREVADSSSQEFSLSDAEFNAVRRLVHRYTGIALADTKQHLVYSRLVRRLRQKKLRSFSEYLNFVEQDAREREEFCNAITTNLTSFFREAHHFENLASSVLPLLQRRNASTRRIRIWSAGCSTGEEPYSIAMTVLDTLGHLRDWDIRVLATDLDSNVLATAQAGSYAADRFEKMDRQRLGRWFNQSAKSGQYVAKDELKRLIAFKRLNLIESWPVRGPFDVIFCRNVVIYFDKPTQRKLFAQMAGLQRPGDHLFIGHSESLFNVCDQYELIGQTIHRRLSMTAAAANPSLKQGLPRALPQFAHISRHLDPRLNAVVAKLLPGEYYVTTQGEMIATVLGSCVSACVRDRDLKIGGMNHFMLPVDASDGQQCLGRRR